jgi:DNA-binding transcriptional MerR regulator
VNEERHISQSATALGISPGYLRLLEREGKIPLARRDRFGSRIYTDLDLAILRALGVGQRPCRLKSPDELLAGTR